MKVKYKVFGDLDNNCYLIVDESTNKSALVDCTAADKRMFDLVGDTDLEYILLTHGHFDHIGGVRDTKQKYGAKVAISKQDEPMLSSGKASLAAFCSAPQNDTEADLIVADGDEIKVGNITLKVISTPGHTLGSVCYAADNALFSGDTLFRCSCGRTDFPTGSSDDMLRSLKKLAALDGSYIVYPGHGELSDLDFERKNNPYMNL